jgi:hypothetical protein
MPRAPYAATAVLRLLPSIMFRTAPAVIRKATFWIAVETLRKLLQRFGINRRSLAFPGPNFPLAGGEARLAEVGAARLDDEAGEIDARVGAVQMLFTRMQMQAEGGLQKLIHLHIPGVEDGRVFVKEDHVVDVAAVMPGFEAVLHVLVQLVQV